MSEQVEAILGETVSALSRLQTDELEELERRLTLIAEMHGIGSAVSSRRLQTKLDLLQGCLNSTADNLRVLDRLRTRIPGRGVSA